MFYVMAILGNSEYVKRSLLGVPNLHSTLLTVPGSDQDTTEIPPGTPGLEFLRDRKNPSSTSRELRQLSPEGIVSAFNTIMSDTQLNGVEDGQLRNRMRPDRSGNFSMYILSCEGDAYDPLPRELYLVGAAIQKHMHAADLLDAELPEGWSVFGTWAGDRDLSRSDAVDLSLDEFYWLHGLPESLRTPAPEPAYSALQLELF